MQSHILKKTGLDYLFGCISMGQVKSPNEKASTSSDETCHLVCLICKKTFANEKELSVHMKKAHAAQMGI